MGDSLTSLPVFVLAPTMAAAEIDMPADDLAFSFYEQTRPQMRARILREEGGTVPFESGALGRLMKRLQLRGNVLASALRFHESVITYYRNGRIPLPKIVYESLAEAADEREALLLLRRNIAQATTHHRARQICNEKAVALEVPKESTWLPMYQQAPSFFRSQILRGESEITSVRGAGKEFRRLLKHLGLGVKETAEFLGLSEAAVKFYGNDSSSIPGRILLALKRANNKAEALQYLSDMIAKAMAVFVDRVPHYQDLFELHRLLQVEGVHLDSFLGRVQYRDLDSATARQVIAILEKKIPLAAKQQLARQLFPRSFLRPTFFAGDPNTKILKEALQKFGISREELALLLGIGTKRLAELINGREPVARRLRPYIQAMKEAETLEDFRVQAAQIQKSKSKTIEVVLDKDFTNMVLEWMPRMKRMAMHALQKYSLASSANAADVAEEVLEALLRAEFHGQLFNDQKMGHWLPRVTRAKAFRFFLQSRGVSVHDAKFYFRMRDLMRVHANKTGRDFTAEDLQAFDPSLSLKDAQANMERFEEVERRIRGMEVSMEDLSPAARAGL